MEAVVGLVVMLLGVSHGVETYCDGRQDGAQCYGALGGTVVLQLMDDASEITRYQWTKELKVILIGRKHVVTYNIIENRSDFIPNNGTFRINELSRRDSGKYTLTISDANGVGVGRWTLQLSIQAPVSSVQLVTECLSQGEMWVSCSSEGGDSPRYSWTLDGRTLTDAELLSGSSDANNITLKQHVSGRLVCFVKNHVNNVSEGQSISTCGFTFINCILSNGTHISQWVFEANNTLCRPTMDPTTVTDTTVGKETGIVSIKPSTNITSSNRTVASSTDDPWYIKNNIFAIMAGVISALVIFLVVGITVICAQKKKQNNKAKEEEDDHELTYADVKIVQRQGRRVEQRAAEEVEYGQVKFSERPRHAEPTADDCVYAKVRKGR